MDDNPERYERPEEERCASCRFFDFEGDHDEHEGLCRRLAPEPRLFTSDNGGDVPEVAWPRVYETDWCGEWQRIVKKPPGAT